MVYWVAVVVYALDQVVKSWVRGHMIPGDAVPVWPPVLYWDYVRNPGGAFSILPNQRWLFIVVAVVVAVCIIYIQRRYRPTRWTQIGMGLLLAGALGNLTDRMLFGTVVDYVYVQIIHFPVFNIADAAIDVGLAMLIISSFRSRGSANG